VSAALDMITGTLLPTATYASRSYVWFPATPGVYPDGRLGTLHVTLQRSARPGAKVEHDAYGVKPSPFRPVPHGAAVFLICNDESGEIYQCTIYPAMPTASACTCAAGQARLECKHLCSLQALLTEGVL
jgi:hypothetical protein